MDEYIRQLRAYIREHKIIFEEVCPQPCLDALWWHYGEYHALDCLDPLPIKDSDAVFEYVVYLCAEYERIAFATGLKLGTQLMMELAGETSVDQ